MNITVTQTTALTIHAELELSTLSEEELRKVAEQLDTAARTVRSELTRRWVAEGRPTCSLAAKVLASLNVK